MRQIFTSKLAKTEYTDINPQYLPINLTIPIPFSEDIASIFADSMNFIDYWTAVENPKLLSIKGISLSIVFGIPQTDMLRFLSLIISINLQIPKWVPLPPMIYN